MDPVTLTRVEAGVTLPFVVWTTNEPWLVLSSAAVGGGLGPRRWIINAQVAHGYARTDLDVHVAELVLRTGRHAGSRLAPGAGVGLFTAADVAVLSTARRRRRARRRHRRRARPDLGGGAARRAGRRRRHHQHRRLRAGATVRRRPRQRRHHLTEAKSQALFDAGVAGTGTATDAVCVACPLDADVEAHFGGPRSEWGSRLARAIYAAVASSPDGGERPMITLVLGGARSGKSEVAERLTQRHDGPLVYLATGRAGDDADMAARIEAHRRRRDSRFEVIEAGAELVAAFAPPRRDPCWSMPSAPGSPPIVTSTPSPRAASTICAPPSPPGPCPRCSCRTRWASGVHPETAVGRAFRDALGLVNQRVAAVADEVWLVVAGRVLRLDPPPS